MRVRRKILASGGSGRNRRAGYALVRRKIMKTKTKFCLAFIVLILMACGCSFQENRSTQDHVLSESKISPEEISQIYQAIIVSDGYYLADGQVMLIFEYAGLDLGPIPPFAEHAVLVYKSPERLPDLEAQTWENFLDVNSHPIKLDKNLELGTDYILITASEYQELYEKPMFFAMAVRTPYPKSGSVEFLSQIGMNENHDQALVYWIYYCGAECAAGEFYLLQKENGMWLVIDRVTTIQS